MIRQALITVAFVLAPPVMAQETRRSVPDAKPPHATISAADWLTGTWRGPGVRGAPAMETYSATSAGQISGHFEQLGSDGRVSFYELLQIVERDGSLVYRLKHFDAELKGWEEKNEVESFALVAVEPGALHFDGLSFYRQGRNRLRVVVRIERADAPPTELAFDYVRATQ